MPEFVEKHRGGKALHYEGYTYLKIRDGLQGNTFRRCKIYKSGCSGRATSEESNVVVRQEHNHPPDLHGCFQKRSKVVSRIMKRAREETVSIHRIYDETYIYMCRYKTKMYKNYKILMKIAIMTDTNIY